jgi:hypothetical protein
MHKYPRRHEDVMRRQIENLMSDFPGMSRDRQVSIKEILGRYIQGEIGLNEAYYELLDNELIAMPQRCGMKPRLQENEEGLKKYIKSKLFG